MAEYTLKVRRYQPESGDGPYWEEFDVDLDPSLSVLDGLLQARDREDGSLSVRCSCRAAICGSCGVKINGSSTLACKTQRSCLWKEVPTLLSGIGSCRRGQKISSRVHRPTPRRFFLSWSTFVEGSATASMTRCCRSRASL